MSTLQRIGGPASAFDQARQQIAEWETEYGRSLPAPRVEPRILLVRYDDEVCVTLAGKDDRPSSVAGAFAMASHVVLENA